MVPLLAVATTSLGLLTPIGSATTAGADPIGSCTTTSGVIVAVDFAPWGGNIERGCDATLTTGYAALQAAGFTTAGDEHDGPEFICRIDDDPPPSQDPCINTPPATAYWSYWHADAGQDTWTYSTLGAASYQPLPGSVDAWTFGSTDLGGADGQPPFPPSAVRATNAAVPATSIPPAAPSETVAPAPAPSASGSKRVRKVRSAAARSRGPEAAASTTEPVPTTTSPTTTEPPPTTTTSSLPVASSSSSDPTVVDAVPASVDQPSSGSPVALIVGGALAAVLAAVAAVVARRPRRPGHGRRLPRTLHPIAWWIWALGLATAVSYTTNPVLLLLVLCVLAVVVANRRSDAPWARAFKYYLYLAFTVVVIRLVFRSVFAGVPDTRGLTVLLRLPQVPLPSWAATGCGWAPSSAAWVRPTPWPTPSGPSGCCPAPSTSWAWPWWSP
jgi:hypothetical protein